MATCSAAWETDGSGSFGSGAAGTEGATLETGGTLAKAEGSSGSGTDGVLAGWVSCTGSGSSREGEGEGVRAGEGVDAVEGEGGGVTVAEGDGSVTAETEGGGVSAVSELSPQPAMMPPIPMTNSMAMPTAQAL